MYRSDEAPGIAKMRAVEVALRITCAAGLLFFAGINKAMADEVDDFYKGKTVRIIVGNPPGGGYDAYARMLGRFLGRYIPGTPTVIVSNMPGASGLTAANHIANIAPRDGTVIGMMNRSNVLDPLFGVSQARYDSRKLEWIGNMNSEVSVCVTWHSSGVTSLQDLLTKTISVGATGPGDDTLTMPTVLNRILGTKLKIVTGYAGGSDIDLAVERGEVDGRCGMSYSTLAATRPSWLSEKKVNLLAQFATAKHSALPNVPLVTEFQMTDRQRSMLEVIFARQTWGRPFVAPGEVPKDRVQALRAAFDRAMADPELIKQAKDAKLELMLTSGEAMQQGIAALYQLPSDVIEEARRATE